MPVVHPPNDERRDTYDSRRIDGLMDMVAKMTIHVENLRDDVKNCTESIAAIGVMNERITQLRKSVDDSVKSTRSLRNSVVSGCVVAAFVLAADLVIKGV